jgi:DNA ligase-associated metallophosphoesterase
LKPDAAITVAAGDETLLLLPGRAAFWPRAATLLIADAHLGKAAAFRRAGIPVPRGTTDENLARLSALVRDCGAARIVFLGDLVHDAAARRAASHAFVRWRQAHCDLEILLVRGNHDRRAGDPAREWNVDVACEPFVEGGLALCHTPRHVPGSYAVAGHIHPGVRLSGRGRETIRLPCFWFTRGHAVLPAFGAFTGLADVCPSAEDGVFVEIGDGTLAVIQAGAASMRPSSA